MSNLLNYKVESIPKQEAYPWLLKKHYAKTIPNIMYCFGIFKENLLHGVCSYGTPANNHNNALGKFKMIELVRLVIDDNHEKNILSYFVAQTFKLLPRPLALISYADSGKNHHGYIYQATNWIYTGLGGGVDFYIDKDQNEIHPRIMSDYRKKYPSKTRDEITQMLEWKKVKGTYKHRYFYFLGNKKEKKEMRLELLSKYKILKYPKGDNINYDASYTPEIQRTLF